MPEFDSLVPVCVDNSFRIATTEHISGIGTSKLICLDIEVIGFVEVATIEEFIIGNLHQ